MGLIFRPPARGRRGHCPHLNRPFKRGDVFGPILGSVWNTFGSSFRSSFWSSFWSQFWIQKTTTNFNRICAEPDPFGVPFLVSFSDPFLDSFLTFVGHSLDYFLYYFWDDLLMLLDAFLDLCLSEHICTHPAYLDISGRICSY